MKWPFQRKNKDNVPAEIQEYYQAEKRERTGVAWLIAIFTLLLTIAIALALFFGGRWVYRKLTNNDTATPPSSQEEAQTPSTEDGSGDADDEDPADTPETPGATDDDQPETPTTPPARPGSPTPTPPAATPPATPGTPGTGTPSAGSTSDNTEPLPNTGPGAVAGLVAASSLAGATVHQLYTARRRRR